MTYYSATIVLQLHFKENRALAHGIGMLGYSCGFVISPSLTNALIYHFGWKGTTLLIGGILLHRVPLSLEFQPPAQKIKEPNEGDNNDKTTNGCSRIAAKFIDCSLVKHSSLMFFLVSEFLTKIFLMSFPHHLPSYVVHKGFSTQEAASAVTLIHVFNAVFRILTSFVSNIKWVNRLLLYACGALVASVSVAIMQFIQNYNGIVASCILAGCHVGR